MANCGGAVSEGKDPYRTIVIFKLNGLEVARRNVMHPHCREYLEERINHAVQQAGGSGTVTWEFEEDLFGGLFV